MHVREMLTPSLGSKIGWKGSLSSLKAGPRASSASKRTSEEPDLLNGVRRVRTESCGKEAAPDRGSKRKGFRKRFLSLTDGITGLFSPDKKTRGSQESLWGGEHPGVGGGWRKEPFSTLGTGGGHRDALDAETSLRRHADSFSSFRPSNGSLSPSLRESGSRSPQQKGRSPALDRLKKAPPSPPPRRCSSWLTPDSRARLAGDIPLTKAVLSSSTPHPRHLRLSPPPPPVRYCYLPSPRPLPSPRLPSSSRLRVPPYTHRREGSVPSEFPRAHSKPNSSKRLENYPSSSSGSSVIEKTVSIILQKENGTFGFTLRGGMSTDGVSRALLVTHVRPGGPADREGSLKAGDRLVALDGKDLTRLSLCEAQVALQEVENSATFAIRFDISVMDPVRCGGGPLLVEIERAPGSSLGLSLNAPRSPYGLCNTSLPKSNVSSGVVIESIRSASIAERCGALAVGDAVCSVDGLRLDQNSLKEANQILNLGQGHKVTLEVIPNRSSIRARAGSPVLTSPLCTHRFSFYNTLGPSRPSNTTSTRNNRRLREGSPLSPGSPGILSHAEAVRVTLLAEGMSVGMVLRPALDGTFPLVAAIDPGGATDKLGVICIGDRILGVNGRSVNGLSVSEVTQMLNNTRPTVIIDLEIDVTDSVVPSSGTFSVKLSKRQCCLGINVARGRHPSPGDPAGEAVLISEIIQGSSAHRSGTLQVGDRIMSINNTRLDSLTLDQTRALLQDPENDVVTLKVQKDDLYSDDTKCITYTVQIHRDKGALGISATGSEEPFDPIIVKGIAPGSLAAQTGAIHIGDRLLSINGISLRGKPLSEAIRLLQGNEDNVALKISRPKEPRLSSNVVSQDWLGFHAPPAPSVDSAVESWGSGGIDLPSNEASTLLSGKTDSTPELFRSNCGSTVRRKTQTKSSSSDRGSTSNEERKSWGCSSHSSDSGQSEDGTDWEKMIADLNQISATCGLRGKSVLHDANGNLMAPLQSNGETPFLNPMTVNSSEPGAKPPDDSTTAAVSTSFKFGRRTASPEDVFDEGTYSVSYAAALRNAAPQPSAEEPCPVTPPHIFTLTLAKDPFYEDFGFSVSDGLYEKGVYVNRIRKGGPAYRSGLLKPYDRILQVNETQTEDFDCCLTVPLIAAAEESLFLKVSRTSNGTSLPSSFRLFNDLRMNAWLQTEDEDDPNVANPNCNRVS